MDFEFSDEQKMLRETVRRYLRERIAPLAAALDRQGPLPKHTAHDFLRELKQFGYVGTLVSPEYGGPGLCHLDWAVLHEELRKVFAGLGGVVGITSTTTKRIADSGNEELKRRVLPGLLSGDKISCTAITEPNVGSNASAVETKAVLDGSHYVLNGTKMWISNGTIADYVVVVATMDKSLGSKGTLSLLVEREVSPFESREISKMGLKSFPTGELIFEDCRVPKENILDQPGHGVDKALRRLVFARCNAALAAVAIAQAALDSSVRYAQERTQFGKPIGKFQMIQEMIADMAAEIDAARFLAYRAFWLLDKGARCAMESSLAKAFATEAGVRVTSKAIQIHGAYGLSEEYPVERYFRDSRCYTIPDGTTQIQKLIIGREILGMSAIS